MRRPVPLEGSGDAEKGGVCDHGIGLGECLMELKCITKGFIAVMA